MHSLIIGCFTRCVDTSRSSQGPLMPSSESSATDRGVCTQCLRDHGYTTERNCDSVKGVSRGPHEQATD